MHVGIEAIQLYTSPLSTDALEIAKAAGKNPKMMAERVMLNTRTVVPPFEDAVTLAVNAARRLLSAADTASIELLIVATESGVDFGKPISTWVHRLCGLQPNCRNVEIKHACYGGTAALKFAAMWLKSAAPAGKKALVISTDLTRPKPGLDFDSVGGGCAIAMLVSDNPKILTIDLANAGYWTREVTDVFRPTASLETGDTQTSLVSYLDALDGAFEHYTQVVGHIDYFQKFKKHIYHAPFPGMTFQAHRAMMDRFTYMDSASVRRSFRQKVEDGLAFSRRIGTAYGASNFVCLLSLLHYAPDLIPGDEISFFAYGSGCQGEFYGGIVGSNAGDAVRSLRLDCHLDERRSLTLEEFIENESRRAQVIECADCHPINQHTKLLYDECYTGKDLLVLEQVDNYYRHYKWS